MGQSFTWKWCLEAADFFSKSSPFDFCSRNQGTFDLAGSNISFLHTQPKSNNRKSSESISGWTIAHSGQLGLEGNRCVCACVWVCVCTWMVRWLKQQLQFHCKLLEKTVEMFRWSCRCWKRGFGWNAEHKQCAVTKSIIVQHNWKSEHSSRNIAVHRQTYVKRGKANVVHMLHRNL